jgi:hypothetical protein
MTQPILGQPVDERTQSLNLPLPSLSNMQDDDVPRLREALRMLDAAFKLIDEAKADKTALTAGLQTKLTRTFSDLALQQGLDGSELLALATSADMRRATVADLDSWFRTKNGAWPLLQKFLGGLQTRSINGGQLAGTRNRLINGRCNVAQRGTSFPGASISTGNFPVDRLAFTGSYTPAVVTLEQAADGPALDPGLRRSARLTVTTADPAMDGGDSAGFQQIIEGYNIADLFGVTFTLSFWVRSSRVGVHCLALFNGGFDKSFVAEYSVQNANTWEFKSVTIVGGLPAAGGWNTSWGPGLYVRWSVGVGPAYQTQPGVWRDGLYLGTSSQVNCLDTAGNVVALTGFRLEPGSVDTPFEHRQISNEMDDCLRYFEQMNNGNANVYAIGMVPNNSQVWALLGYATKRVAPSLSFPGSVPNFQFQIGNGTPSCTDRPSANSAGTKRAHIVLPSVSAGLAGDSKACLCVLAGDARININAEF